MGLTHCKKRGNIAPSSAADHTVLVMIIFHWLWLSPWLLSHAADALSMGQSLLDGQTVVSPGAKFELGFFTPVNSTARYVGIWHYNIPPEAPIWVANRDQPIVTGSGVLTFAPDGNLVVQDGNQTKWTTAVSSTIVNATISLSDFGNLALRDRFDRTWWESYDNPTDTFVPGMRTGLDRRTGRNTLFRSWSSPSDPSPGNFSMAMDPSGHAQILIFSGHRRRWRTGYWDGQSFTGLPTAPHHYPYGFRLSDDDQEGKIYFTYTLYDPSVLVKFVLTPAGVEQELVWSATARAWRPIWAQPVAECEFYNWCGAFGVCRGSAPPATRCVCIKGYVARDGTRWGAGDWSAGCMRRVDLQCNNSSSSNSSSSMGGGDDDGFYAYGEVKLPDMGEAVAALDGKERCELWCRSNCSCRAYAFDRGLGCMVWWKDLVDIQKFDGAGNVLYVRLHNSELGGGNNRPKFVIEVVVILGTFILAALVSLILIRKRRQIGGLIWKKRQLTNEITYFDFGHDVAIPPDTTAAISIGKREGNGTPDLPLVTFSFVAAATDNFSNENKLGEGGFGPVYKGKLPSGETVAVKRLSRLSGQGMEEFKNEVILIARLQHRNLVRLVAFCVEDEEKMLLYEYMPNKSLDVFLFDARYRLTLDWTKRFHIIHGIARGLLYLHRDSRLRIIHRDLKPSNILLDEEMNPKISDFGMARIFGGNQNQANTNRVVGTYGYMSPEYAMEGLFSTKSDVYSFGVLILEIVSGKKNAHFCQSDSLLKLLPHAWKLWSTDRAMELVDSGIRDSCQMDELMRCVQVGLLCVQDERVDRPDMSTVVPMLETGTANCPSPKQPSFTFAASPRERVLLDLQQTTSSSGNEISITMTTGR